MMSVDSDTPSTIGSSPCCSVLFSSSAVGVASEMMGVGIKGAGWTMTLGILVIISAFLVLFNPIIGVGVVVFWVGLSLLLAGVDLIAHAVTLRRLRKEL